MENKDLTALEQTAQQQRYYVNHLAEINKQKSVISSEDVYSESGVMLVKKGARISFNIAERILQHKLLKPLEQQIQVEQCQTPSSLAQQFQALFDKFPDIGQIHSRYAFDGSLKFLIQKSCGDPILLQKLTVLSERLPDVYEKSIFTAWLSAFIATKLNLSKVHILDTFRAGLFHDLGLLNIDPQVLNKKGKLTTEEWRSIQSHVVIGYLIFKNIDGPKSVTAQAILEHHECCDGTGYPLGKSADQLSVIGQIIAMADSLQAIRINRFIHTGMNLRDTLPFLHMNSNRHFLNVYKSVCNIINESQLTLTTNNHYPDYDTLVKTLTERVDVLQDAIVVLMLIQELAVAEDTGVYDRLIKVVGPVLHMIKSSGMVRDELIMWLKKLTLQPDDSVIRDLLEMDLMQMELLWQLKKAVRVTNEFLAHHPILTTTQRSHLQKLSDYIYDTLDSHGKT